MFCVSPFFPDRQYYHDFTKIYHSHTGKKYIFINLYAIFGQNCPHMAYKFQEMSFLRCISLIYFVKLWVFQILKKWGNSNRGCRLTSTGDNL